MSASGRLSSCRSAMQVSHSTVPSSIRLGHRLGWFAASLWVGLSALTSGRRNRAGGLVGSAFRYDVLVSCRDVTTAAAGLSDPQQRLVEARFQVTALPAEGEPAADMQYVYQFLSPTGNLQIVDYQPRTTQTTRGGHRGDRAAQEANKSLDASVSGGFPPSSRGGRRMWRRSGCPTSATNSNRRWK